MAALMMSGKPILRATEQASSADATGVSVPGNTGTPAEAARLRAAASGCRGCDLYRDATGTVFGAGPAHARVMIVGEVPGDLDLTTDATPEQVLEITRKWADKTWTVGIEFGTVGLRKRDVYDAVLRARPPRP